MKTIIDNPQDPFKVEELRYNATTSSFYSQ